MAIGRTSSTAHFLVVLACASALGACRESPPPDAGLPDSVYVQVLARLQVIPAPTDSAGRVRADSLRARVLADYGVDSLRLLAFAEVVGRQPARSEEIWKRIGMAVDSLREIETLDPELPAADSSNDPGALPGASAPVGDSADLRGDSGTVADPADVRGDSAEARGAPIDTPHLEPGARRDRPVAGQPVRRP